MKRTLIIVLCLLCVATSQAKRDTLVHTNNTNGIVTMKIVETPEFTPIVLENKSFKNTTGYSYSDKEVLKLLSGDSLEKYKGNEMVRLFPPEFQDIKEKVFLENRETKAVPIDTPTELSVLFLVSIMILPHLINICLGIFTENKNKILIFYVAFIVMGSTLPVIAMFGYGLPFVYLCSVCLIIGAVATVILVKYSAFSFYLVLASLCLVAVGGLPTIINNGNELSDGHLSSSYIGLVLVSCLVSYGLRQLWFRHRPLWITYA